VFFSHNKSANSVFQPAYQHSRTGSDWPFWTVYLVRFYLCFRITRTRYLLNYVQVTEICGVGPLFAAFRLQSPEVRTDQIRNCLIYCCGTTQVTDIFVVLRSALMHMGARQRPGGASGLSESIIASSTSTTQQPTFYQYQSSTRPTELGVFCFG